MSFLIERAHHISSKQNEKRPTPQDILLWHFESLGIKAWKASRERGKKQTKMASDFSSVSLKGEILWSNAFKVLRGKDIQPGMLVRQTINQVWRENEDMWEDVEYIPGQGSVRVKPWSIAHHGGLLQSEYLEGEGRVMSMRCSFSYLAQGNCWGLQEGKWHNPISVWEIWSSNTGETG